jgi:hypothetical protein
MQVKWNGKGNLLIGTKLLPPGAVFEAEDDFIGKQPDFIQKEMEAVTEGQAPITLEEAPVKRGRKSME